MFSVPVMLVSRKLDGARIGIGYGDQCGKMKHDVGVVDQLQAEVSIADIAGNYLDRGE